MPNAAPAGELRVTVGNMFAVELVMTACAVASTLLGNAVNTLLAAASMLRSPVAVPSGLLDAFGRLAPASVTFDDLEANGVLHTPTSVWGLLPRIGPRRDRPPRDVKDGVQTAGVKAD